RPIAVAGGGAEGDVGGRGKGGVVGRANEVGDGRCVVGNRNGHYRGGRSQSKVIRGDRPNLITSDRHTVPGKIVGSRGRLAEFGVVLVKLHFGDAEQIGRRDANRNVGWREKHGAIDRTGDANERHVVADDGDVHHCRGDGNSVIIRGHRRQLIVADAGIAPNDSVRRSGGPAEKRVVGIK